jgi:hypothetical protein
MITDRRSMSLVPKVLRILIVLNLVSLPFFVAILAGSALAEGVIREALLKSDPKQDSAAILAALRIVMSIGIAAVPLAHILLTRLRAVVETVRAGDPFVAANADRLQVIAWCLLGLQLCDLGFGAVSLTLLSEFEAVPGWTFSLTGWLGRGSGAIRQAPRPESSVRSNDQPRPLDDVQGRQRAEQDLMEAGRRGRRHHELYGAVQRHH